MKEQRQWLLLFCHLFSFFFLSEPLFFLIISHITSPLLFFSAKPIHALVNFPWTIITAPYNMIMISVFQFITASITFTKGSSDYITLTKNLQWLPLAHQINKICNMAPALALSSLLDVLLLLSTCFMFQLSSATWNSCTGP